MSDGVPEFVAGVLLGAFIGAMFTHGCAVTPRQQLCERRHVDACIAAHEHDTHAYRVCAGKATQECTP